MLCTVEELPMKFARTLNARYKALGSKGVSGRATCTVAECSPDPVTSSSDPVTSSSDPVTSRPAPVTSSSDPVTSSSDPVTSSSHPVTSSSDPVTSRPAPVTSSSDPVTSRPAPELPLIAAAAIRVPGRSGQPVGSHRSNPVASQIKGTQIDLSMIKNDSVVNLLRDNNCSAKDFSSVPLISSNKFSCSSVDVGGADPARG
jgi:hypothetical protein